MFIWQRPEWPQFRQDEARLGRVLADTRHAQGKLLGRMEALGFDMRSEATLRMLTEDVVKTSEIEGEILAPDQVRSSLATRLGLDAGGLQAPDRNVDGVVEMTLDATRNYAAHLTEERLFSWHAALFPTGYSGMRRIHVGEWRDDTDGPMEVVSGPIGRQRFHYSAPPAGRLGDEMSAFLEWFQGARSMEPVLAAGLAHLWFVSIHPFEDGNGRIARAIADMALARSEDSPERFYSMSAQIRLERNAYYDILKATQKGGLNITDWQIWFLECLGRAIVSARNTLAAVLAKASFWEAHASDVFNERQVRILNRLLDGFEGKLTSSKWARMNRCSQDTANRDIRALIDRGVLVRGPAGGRSTSYELVTARIRDSKRQL
ncbi:MAG: Fic family protein [Alphaproteobacteria bacterium]|nr:Fic family protein [Alphaproteobacteria bacterium]MCY4498878.1 Fic family protein [Rhodospirillaceae bacterium]